MYKIKLQKTLKCLWPVYIDMFAVKWMVFSDVFINHFLKIHRSTLHKITKDLLYFCEVHDVNLWEKLAITVKFCFIETRLEEGCDLRGFLLKITRETINGLLIVVMNYFSKWAAFRSSRSEVFCRRYALKISKNLQQKLVPVTCNFI